MSMIPCNKNVHQTYMLSDEAMHLMNQQELRDYIRSLQTDAQSIGRKINRAENILWCKHRAKA